MRVVVVLPLLVGCGFSAHATSDDVATPDAGPTVDGPITNDDLDGDGIANASDNCPMKSNAAQYDEDVDGKGDDCDPCPQLGTAADDADGDSDGVGDGCDPHPTTAGDKLAYWNGFNVPSTGLPSGLTAIHGSAARWSVAGGYLVFTRNGDDWGVVAADVMAKNHTSDATFDITAEYSSINASAAGVAVDVASNDDDVINCQARTDNDQREMWRWDGRIGGGWSQLDNSSATTPTSTYRIALQRRATDLACTTQRTGNTPVGLTDSTDSLNHTRAGVFARNVDVRYRYLAIYTSP